MRAHRLTAAQVGELVGRRKTTVRIWRVGRERRIPANTLELLELKLAARGGA